MRISDSGVEFIKQWEKFRATPYNDGYGYMTIGYGHLIKPDEYYDEITLEDGEVILRQDISIAEDDVAKYVKVPLKQNQYDAIVSFFFNVGASKIIKGQHTIPDLNYGKYQKFADHLLSWNKSGGKVSRGLTRRRQAERKMFLGQ